MALGSIFSLVYTGLDACAPAELAGACQPGWRHRRRTGTNGVATARGDRLHYGHHRQWRADARESSAVCDVAHALSKVPCRWAVGQATPRNFHQIPCAEGNGKHSCVPRRHSCRRLVFCNFHQIPCAKGSGKHSCVPPVWKQPDRTPMGPCAVREVRRFSSLTYSHNVDKYGRHRISIRAFEQPANHIYQQSRFAAYGITTARVNRSGTFAGPQQRW